MAYRDLGRDDRHRARRLREWAAHPYGGPDDYLHPDDEFSRRGGWRPGSDYYGTGGHGAWVGESLRRKRFGSSFEPSYADVGRSGPFEPNQWPVREGGSREQAGQFRGKGPKGYRRSDERIREDVCERLTEDDAVDASQIEVAVKDCEVTLTGSVQSRVQKLRAEALSERICGVQDVHNRLRVGD